ncbi:hypothetical protein [Alteromonas sp. 14N.309.X.WAT.G.H12]|uniref:hypothetical protein n=1 Tax=Alteromonas sp. 14N.309.X.WAT.G.H12 TaxID=3120824 RepID=UPI002FD156A1
MDFIILIKVGYMECNGMRELNVNDIEQVNGGVSQATAIGVNTAIATAGVGASAAMTSAGLALTATGVGIVAGLILVSVAVTTSYIMEN